MSYEGYVQNLCKNGHHWEAEGGSYADPTVCPECTQPPEWVNPVNDTNCDSIGEIDMNQFLYKEAEYKKCDMGHLHQISPAVYRIPSLDETKKARCWRPEYGDSPLVPLNK